MSDGTKNKTQEDTKAETWIATLLPRGTALSLVLASEVARQLPVGSLARAQVIRNAEKKAKAQCPHAFRDDDGYRQ